MGTRTRTAGSRRPLAAVTAGIAGVAVAGSLAIPATAQDAEEAPERSDPGHRHAEVVEQLAEALDGDADAIAAALAELHEERVAERAARREERQEARETRQTARAQRWDEEGAGRRGDREAQRGPDADGPRRQGDREEGRRSERRGPGSRDGSGEDCPLATS